MTQLSVPAAADSARPGELRVEPEWLADGVCVVSVAGEIDMQTAASFAATLDRLAQTGRTAVIVDPRECSFIDSTGLNALIASQKRLEGGGTPSLSSPPSGCSGCSS